MEVRRTRRKHREKRSASMSSGRRRRRYWVELSFNIVGECCISLLRLGALPRFHVTEHAASALFLPSSPYFSSKKNLESGAAGGKRVRLLGRGTRKEEARRGEERRGEEKSRRRTSERSGRNLLYRPTCRRCNFNGGSGVSCRIVRSRGAMSPKGGTGNRGAEARERRCRHERKGTQGGENRSEGGVSWV